MKFIFEFETENPKHNIPKCKISNFIKQVFDGCKGIDDESVSKIKDTDYSITDISEDTINVTFNMDTESNLLKHIMCAVMDFFLVRVNVKETTRHDKDICPQPITDLEEEWSPVGYANYILKWYGDYIPSDYSRDNKETFNLSIKADIPGKSIQYVDRIIKSLTDKLELTESHDAIWMWHSDYDKDISLNLSTTKMSSEGLELCEKVLIPVMNALLRCDDDIKLPDDLISISTNHNTSPAYDVICESNDGDDEDEVDDSEMDISKSPREIKEEKLMSIRPEPVNDGKCNEIGFIYSNINKSDVDKNYRIIRIFHYVLIGFSMANDNEMNDDYINGKISIDYVNGIPTVKIDGSCRMETLEIGKCMNEMLRYFMKHSISENVLKMLEYLIESHQYVKLFYEFVRVYRSGIKDEFYNMDTSSESCVNIYDVMYKRIRNSIRFAKDREKIMSEFMAIKNIHVLEVLLVARVGLGYQTILTEDEIILSITNSGKSKTLVITFTDPNGKCYKISGPNADDLKEDDFVEVKITEFKINKPIETIVNHRNVMPLFTKHHNHDMNEELLFLTCLNKFFIDSYYMRKIKCSEHDKAYADNTESMLMNNNE